VCHYDYQCKIIGSSDAEVRFQVSTDTFYVDFVGTSVAIACRLEDLRFRMIKGKLNHPQVMKATSYRDGCFWDLDVAAEDGMVLAQIVVDKSGSEVSVKSLLNT